ncbi:MAG: hypothetical protein WA079_00395, partial [Leuconostoc falkenbergense]|uniref:hypothetical protein n=2 Tax=Lactobacillaceae TaxID=33958 RepID=UPI003BB78E3B
MNSVQIQFLLALFGSNKDKKISLNEKDGSDQRSFSRTVFSKNAPEMERNFGLITILNNENLPYNDLLNKKAFLKNGNGKKFFELDNVSEFYQSLLGGISSLNDLMFEYGNDEDNIFDALYDYLTEENNVAVIERVSEQVKRY